MDINLRGSQDNKYYIRDLKTTAPSDLPVYVSMCLCFNESMCQWVYVSISLRVYEPMCLRIRLRERTFFSSIEAGIRARLVSRLRMSTEPRGWPIQAYRMSHVSTIYLNQYSITS